MEVSNLKLRAEVLDVMLFWALAWGLRSIEKPKRTRLANVESEYDFRATKKKCR